MAAKTKKGRPVKAGRIGDLIVVSNQGPKSGANSHYNALRVQLPGGKETNLLLSDHQLKVAQSRAKSNPEDVPAVSFLRNLFD